ncbi:MAG: M23 family peptidase, partial [Actinobacteria bacterium]|nr:M23 family peptidase [Actinomycetota bacterium]
MLRRISVILVSILIMGITSAVAAPVYVFPVAGCKVNYARAHHDYPATDILAK